MYTSSTISAAARTTIPRIEDTIKTLASASKQQWRQLLSNFLKMRELCQPIDHTMMPPVFKACANLQSFEQGIAIHSHAIKLAFDSLTSTTNTIISFYANCGSLDSARKVFDQMPHRDSVSWNVIINAFLGRGDYGRGLGLFRQARVADFEPNVAVLVLVIQASWMLDRLDQGVYVHGFVLRKGFCGDVSVRNSLLNMYARCRDLGSARRMFDEIPERDVITWSAMISGYVQNDRARTALQLFKEMCFESEIDIDGLTAVSVLQACGSLRDVNYGRLLHGLLIRLGFDDELFVGNSLVDMYFKCGQVDSARLVFDLMPEKNSVSWNSIISGLVDNEKNWEAISMYVSMKRSGSESDEVTYVNLLQACKKLKQEFWCKCIHSVLISRQLLSNNLVLNNLLDAYAKCDLMDIATKIFERMDRNVISWSIMISGFARCGRPDEAIAFFKEMQLAGEKPNCVTMLSLLECFALLADLKLVKCSHVVILRNDLENELAITTALLDTYAKCGDLSASREIFKNMPTKNILSWNAMIGAFGRNGQTREALRIFHEMELQNVKPNEVTYLSLLSACSHGGLIEEGLSCFWRMTEDPNVQPKVEHYSCVVDMLGRAGNLERALDIINNMPEGVEAGPAAWGALLSACRSHGNCDLGLEHSSRILELEPSNSAGYLLISSMHAKAGAMEESAKMRLLMKRKGVKVVSGYSLVHVGQSSSRFVSWDSSHMKSKEIYLMLELLHAQIKWCRKKDG